MLNIAVTTPKGNTSPIECTIDSCSIGKSDENLIVLQGWTVAKKHAAIQRKPDGVYIEDLGSSSGTEVNGRKISGRHGPLLPGDKIAIAGYTLEVLDLELPASAPAAPAPTQAAATAAPAFQAATAPAAPAAPATVAPPPPPPPSLSDEARATMTRHLKRVHQLLI